MLKICGSSLCKPSEIIFKSCLAKGIFTLEWEKAHLFRFIEKRQTIRSKLLIDLTSSDMGKNI